MDCVGSVSDFLDEVLESGDDLSLSGDLTVLNTRLSVLLSRVSDLSVSLVHHLGDESRVVRVRVIDIGSFILLLLVGLVMGSDLFILFVDEVDLDSLFVGSVGDLNGVHLLVVLMLDLVDLSVLQIVVVLDLLLVPVLDLSVSVVVLGINFSLLLSSLNLILFSPGGVSLELGDHGTDVVTDLVGLSGDDLLGEMELSGVEFLVFGVDLGSDGLFKPIHLNSLAVHVTVILVDTTVNLVLVVTHELSLSGVDDSSEMLLELTNLDIDLVDSLVVKSVLVVDLIVLVSLGLSDLSGPVSLLTVDLVVHGVSESVDLLVDGVVLLVDHMVSLTLNLVGLGVIDVEVLSIFIG